MERPNYNISRYLDNAKVMEYVKHNFYYNNSIVKTSDCWLTGFRMFKCVIISFFLMIDW